MLNHTVLSDFQCHILDCAKPRSSLIHSTPLELQPPIRMEQLVEGVDKPASFLQWQKEMRELNLQEELAQVERRRLEGRISYEKAALARTGIMERNQKTALLKKEETAKLMQRYVNKQLQEEKEMRDLEQEMVDGHKNSKAAKVKLQEFTQRIVKEVSEQ
ncbi:cilia- and flagella-associated protein 99 isoform X1 [Salmo salar]|uniref:Cilia- and flagella-associated protein 99-like isoform X1 n=2 Tax=Salmo salar TaxID=8030 RepID=A0A1S3QWE0_SALSA|nr:unnamed protein product [Salmo salar]XP_014044433.1 cilia- and flagella-associated protein 99-like isoform X1 [Salmo salar]XP_014044459.1 cilia- and flagella-associated protein 99-like isoform X1 [Salmo salar]XP_014044497.1 unnamed protein product [Salmo salar]XP_014044527.1 unnamed protein product [Salmo salar]XP_014044551.1 cilia- and flagella-associated protein 99-like isoform X1 [Salmo salar]XP_014044582.1 unnamed protein product [Salmo salar]XP_045572350.1 cilia- and flagella-associa|eukprot:XP_014044398.1 PREDICTED: cilia- and flagella-associated protein 99-like isoform X1 [Salmo salar]